MSKESVQRTGLGIPNRGGGDHPRSRLPARPILLHFLRGPAREIPGRRSRCPEQRRQIPVRQKEDSLLVFSSWVQGALTILPSENLVSNIGFGAGGTHVGGESPFANMAMGRVTFPLVHPELLICDAVADAMTEGTMFASLRKERKVSGGLFRGIRRFLRPT